MPQQPAGIPSMQQGPAAAAYGANYTPVAQGMQNTILSQYYPAAAEYGMAGLRGLMSSLAERYANESAQQNLWSRGQGQNTMALLSFLQSLLGNVL